MKPRLLDLFCGAGGAAMGYHRAGFDVIGVDIKPQPRYPFEFHQGDAMTWPLDGFDAIHASPPCQAHTTMSYRWRGSGGKADSHTSLIAAVRHRCKAAKVPYIIENVPGARREMADPIVLTGAAFGLGVHRPRLFESNVLILSHPPMGPQRHQVGVFGQAPDGRRLNTRKDGSINRAARGLAEAQSAMGMPWVDWRGCAEAIPPAYTEFIGKQLMAYVALGVSSEDAP